MLTWRTLVTLCVRVVFEIEADTKIAAHVSRRASSARRARLARLAQRRELFGALSDALRAQFRRRETNTLS